MKLFLSIAAATVLASPALAFDTGDAMRRAGLDADALAAAGVQPNEVADVVDDVETHLTTYGSDLTDADADYAAAREETDRLRRLVRSGQATAQDVTDLATAKQDLAAAQAAQDSALDAIFDAGTASLDSGVVASLATIRGNRAWGLSIEFLAKDRSEQAWVDLRDALSNEEVAIEDGISVDPACATLLSTERADSAISAAKTAHDTNVAAVASSWDSAVNGA